MPSAVTRRLRPILTALAALLLYALLIDAAVETYRSGSAVGAWVAIPVALYVSFTLWLVRQRGAGGPGLATSLWVSSFLFLALLAVTATLPGGLEHGIRVAGYPTAVVLSATTIGVIAFAMVTLMIGSPLPIAMRIAILLAGCYGLVAFSTGIALHRSYVQLMQGHSLWERAPYFLQGTFVGALILVPLAFVFELGLAMARVQLRGRRHRLIAFALGAAIAYSAFTWAG
jgi:hypothetical protein